MKTFLIAVDSKGNKFDSPTSEEHLNHETIQDTLDAYNFKLILIINGDIDKTVSNGTKPALKLVS